MTSIVSEAEGGLVKAALETGSTMKALLFAKFIGPYLGLFPQPSLPSRVAAG